MNVALNQYLVYSYVHQGKSLMKVEMSVSTFTR